MKLFSKNRGKRECSPRENIYEIAKEAHRIGVEGCMKSTTVITENLIDHYCRSLHRPENLGSVFMNTHDVHRVVFGMTLDDDSLTPPQNSDQLDRIIRDVLSFFEKEGFSVTTTRFKNSGRIREATVSIRDEDKISS